MTAQRGKKPKVAFYWCASCGGCEESIIDLAEDILGVVEAVDIVFWPVAMDFKRKNVEVLRDGEIFVAFINGAIRTTEQEEMVHLLRKKSQLIVAYGACSHLGGIPGLANLADRDSIFQEVYQDSPCVVNPQNILPTVTFEENGHRVSLPGFYQTVRTLGQVIDVDYYIPGCAPTPKLTLQAIKTLLGEKLPPKGTVFAKDQALCFECPRKDTKPDDLSLTAFARPHQVLIDEDKCLLAQGICCLGPATRGGCEALCISGNMACTGCFGPTSRVKDYGAKVLASTCSLIGSNDEKEIEKILDGIPDPVGTFYRYSLPSSILRRKKPVTVGESTREKVSVDV